MAVTALPIPAEEYDGFLKQIAHLEIGDPLAQDCQVEEIVDGLPVLDCLLDHSVNIDEMDFLAKRLESFSQDEKTQFQAMAHVMNLTDVKSLINLTYSIDNVTVVRDFSDLEALGRRQFIHASGGAVRPEIIPHINGTKVMLDLFQDRQQQPTITPYGLVYSNGMELQEVYKGGKFPELRDETAVLRCTMSRTPEPASAQDSVSLCFPIASTAFVRTLVRGGLLQEPTYWLHWECEQCPQEVLDAVGSDWVLTGDDRRIFDTNVMCQAIAMLPQRDRDALGAVITFAQPRESCQITQLVKHLGDFDFIPNAQDPEDYARYVIMESSEFSFDPELEPYLNFRQYGEDHVPVESSEFTERGYVEYIGTEPLEAIMTPELPEQEAESPRNRAAGSLAKKKTGPKRER